MAPQIGGQLFGVHLPKQTLEKRREFLSLVQCFKIVFGFEHLSFPDFFEFANNTRTRANHDYKLYLRRAVCNCYKYYFFIRIVRKSRDYQGKRVNPQYRPYIQGNSS